MPQVSVRVSEDLDDEIQHIQDEHDVSRSDAVRTLLERGSEYKRIQRENERLQNAQNTLLQQSEEHTELVEYVSDEQRYRQAGVFTRLKWWLRGMD